MHVSQVLGANAKQSFIPSTNPTRGIKGTIESWYQTRGDNGKPTAELWNSLFKEREQFHPEATADYHQRARTHCYLCVLKGK